MTGTEAVETSVAITNSLSQDYTNLDEQRPQTCMYEYSWEEPFTSFINQSNISKTFELFIHWESLLVVTIEIEEISTVAIVLR